MPGADPGRGAGQVAAGQRDHGKRCGLADFADGDAAAEADQRLLGEVRVAGPGRMLAMPGAGEPTAHGRMTTVAAMAVNNIVGAGRRDGTNRCYVCV